MDIWPPDYRALLIGVAAFIAVVFGVPLVGTLIASLGLQHMFEERASSFYAYDYVLILGVGALTGLLARRSAVGTGALAGACGKLALVVLSALAGYWSVEAAALSRLLFGMIASMVLCSIGCVSANRLFRHRTGL